MQILHVWFPSDGEGGREGEGGGGRRGRVYALQCHESY